MGWDGRQRELGEEMRLLTESIIGACIEVHRELGPELKEDMYESALYHEFELRGIGYERQVKAPVTYKGKPIGEVRLDLIVERKVIVELKACDGLNEVHRAQILCYLKITHLQLGLLINYNVAILKDGVKRVILSC